MRVTELKALARDRGLRNYPQIRKAELVASLQNNPPPAPHTRPPPPALQRCTAPAPRMSLSGASPRGATWEPTDDRRPRKPTQEMDIFEQQEMSKNQSSDILQHSQNRPTGDKWLKF